MKVVSVNPIIRRQGRTKPAVAASGLVPGGGNRCRKGVALPRVTTSIKLVLVPDDY